MVFAIYISYCMLASCAVQTLIAEVGEEQQDLQKELLRDMRSPTWHRLHSSNSFLASL